MIDQITQKIYYSDTDAYGVTWHGSYLRWMEMGRVEFCSKLGFDLVELQKRNIIFVVTNLQIKYKFPAKVNEEIIIETSLSKITPLTFTFTQIIKNKETKKVNTIAEVEVVMIKEDGKLCRKIPKEIIDIFEGALECKD